MTLLIRYLLNLLRFDPREHQNEIRIRVGTKYEEAIPVKRSWIHPWRKTVKSFSASYYDIAIQELGKFRLTENVFQPT